MKTGACHCGSTRFSYAGEGIACYCCHCTECQTASGTAFTTNLIVESSDLELVSGTASEFVYVNNGRELACVRCSTCATLLWVYFVGDEAFCSVQTGTFDDAMAFVPNAHIWTQSKVSWLTLPSDCKCYKEQPDFDDLVADWKRRPSLT